MTNEISVLGLLCDLEVWRLGFNPSYEQRVQKSAVPPGRASYWTALEVARRVPPVDLGGIGVSPMFWRASGRLV